MMQRGISFEDSKERIDDIVEEQKRIRDVMRKKNKTEEEIKIKQKKLLEELWGYSDG